MDKIRRPRFFYGWVIVATGFAIYATFGGGLFYSYGVFFPVMLDDLGFSRGPGSTAVSILILTQAISAPIVGLIITRVGVKKVMIFGSLLMITTMLLMSRVTTIWHIYLVYGILASISILTAGFISILTLVNNWFSRRRSLAISICMAGVSMGTMVLAPLIRYLIEEIGWRQTWWVLAGIACVTALVPAIFLVKARPQDIGQNIDGDITGDKVSSESPSYVYKTPVDWELKSALKTPAFWLIGLIGSANMFTLSMLSTHQVAHLEDIGFTPVVAASAVGFLVGISIVGRLAGGVIGDRFEPRYVAAVACAFQVIALLMFMYARTLPLLYSYVVILGVAYGSLLTLFPAILSNYYGRTNFSAIFGIATGMTTLLGATGPAIAGFAFDASGSYTIPLVTATVLVAAAGILALIARPPKVSGYS